MKREWLFLLGIIIVLTLAPALGPNAQTPAELIMNGGFENGDVTPWVVESSQGGVLISGPGANGNPHGGNRFVLLGGANQQTDAIEQAVIVPQNAVDLTLSFALKIKATGHDLTPHDFFRVILIEDEYYEHVVAEYSNADASDWQLVTVPDLSFLASRLVLVRFEAVTDGKKPTKFSVDDVSLIYTPGQEPHTPDLEFISPRFGCLIHPGPVDFTISGAAPLSVLGDAPSGVQSLSVAIDGKEVGATTANRLDVSIDWSLLPLGEHILEGTIIDIDGGVAVKRCTVKSTNLLEAGDIEGVFVESAWAPDGAATMDSLIEVDKTFAVSGSRVIALGDGPNSTASMEQVVSIPPDAQDVVTLAFFYKTASDKSLDTRNRLTIHFEDLDTDLSYPVATLYPSQGGWQLCRVPISMGGQGMPAAADYIMKFQVDTAPGSNATTFYLDDVALYVYSSMLASGITDYPDEDGDLPGENSVGHSITVSPHRDVPNTCSCGYGAHRTVTIQANGFGSLPQGCNVSPGQLKVKFKVDGANRGRSATNVCVDGNTITCTVPDCKDRNHLGAVRIKVKKVSSGKKAWTEKYSINGAGIETGFFYGFPDPITNIQLQSDSMPSILGGDDFSVSADGFQAFTEYRNSTKTCWPPRMGHDQNPVIFARDSDDPSIKVRVKKSTLTNSCGSNTWTGKWADDGAPIFCPEEPICDDPPSVHVPWCIPTSTTPDRILRLLNPDNFKTDCWGLPETKHEKYRGNVLNAVGFATPSSPTISSASPNYAYSVGAGAVLGDCYAASATNKVNFTGTNLFRIRNVKTIGAYPNHPEWAELTGSNGASIKGKAPKYPKGEAQIRIMTADGQTVWGNGFEYKNSWKPYRDPYNPNLNEPACPRRWDLPFVHNVTGPTYPLGWWRIMTGQGEDVRVSLVGGGGVQLIPTLDVVEDEINHVRITTLGIEPFPPFPANCASASYLAISKPAPLPIPCIQWIAISRSTTRTTTVYP